MTACNKDILNRLKRTEGQLRGSKMIEDEKECVDVITQLSAVSSSVNRIMGIIVAENLKNCLENPQRHGNPAENRSSRSADREEITEFLKGLSRFFI